MTGAVTGGEGVLTTGVTEDPVHPGPQLPRVSASGAAAGEVPVVLELTHPIRVAEAVILIVEIVGGDLCAPGDVHHCPADKSKVVSGEADCVGLAGVIDDGAGGEEALDVYVLVLVLPDDVGVGVDDPDHPHHKGPGKMAQSAKHPDERDHSLLSICGLMRVFLSMIHQHVDLLPSLLVIVLEPQESEDYDGIV